jgi:hypothetical protein
MAQPIPGPIHTPTAKSDSTLVEQPSFPFLRVSPELRLQIYRHVFAPANGVPYWTLFVWFDAQDDAHIIKRARSSTSAHFLRCCKQIAEEALPMLYGENVYNLCFTYLPVKGQVVQQEVTNFVQHIHVEHFDFTATVNPMVEAAGKFPS